MSETITTKLNVGGEKVNGRHADRQQFDIGGYVVFENYGTSSQLEVGRLFVMAGSEPNELIEYWGLKSGFVRPSMSTTDKTLTFQPDGNIAAYGSAADFKQHLTTEGYSSCITATCIEESL
jgi:hypothetical protein